MMEQILNWHFDEEIVEARFNARALTILTKDMARYTLNGSHKSLDDLNSRLAKRRERIKRMCST